MLLYLGVLLSSIIQIVNYYIGQYCYCKKLYQHDDGSELAEETESTIVRIKVPYSERNCCPDKISSNVPNRKESSTNLDKTKETKLVQEARPVFSEETRTVSAKLPHNGRRTAIWAPALKNQLDNITNSSSEVCRNTTIVQAQIEARPMNITTDDIYAESLRDDYANSSQHSPRRSYLTDKRTKKLKWKKEICSRLGQLKVKDLKTNESRQKFRNQKLDIPARTFNNLSPIQHSTTLHKNRLASVFTSTRISVSGSNLRPTDDEAMAKNGNKMEEYDGISKKFQNDHPSIVNLNEKSICNLAINDITMNQAQLSDIFESTSMSTSVLTTKEALIITLKFYREERNNGMPRKKDTSFCEFPLLRVFTSLPRMFQDFSVKLFSSQQAQKNSIPFIRVSDYSKTATNSRNETMYMEPPNVGKKLTGNESVYDRR
ncbi:uncharacterized protein LOC122569796 [Bombus pyrosoma]|uniref:uncharacterized protein LOC122569796 n=1 Tax=Bombus pyrosoma TaxID=396416 RepID=UPI001CB95A81|nr:uncharacterized protein LOC122569796 [Bombus pyrosoma]